MSICNQDYSTSGCQVPVGNGVCGETKSLSIINEFKKLYEEKLQQIDCAAGGDCLQEKIRIQQEWIGDLTEQNEMLVRAVCELECEATERVQMLEEKLQQSARSICEVMKKYRENDVTNELLAEPLQRIFHLENDQKNLLEFIRRLRDNKQLSVDGLTFYEIRPKDLLEKNPSVDDKLSHTECLEAEEMYKKNEHMVNELQCKLQNQQAHCNDIDRLSKELKCKTDECETLRQVMSETRQVLTEEVASKHDEIVLLKRDIVSLEERCIQADKQTAFRDDIIKELRKENKQLKQQLPEKCLQTYDYQNPNMPERSSPRRDRPSPSHSITPRSPVSVSKNSENTAEKPYLIINHSSKRQIGKNTVILIHKDGTVERSTSTVNSDQSSKQMTTVYEQHQQTCVKCKQRIEKIKEKNNNELDCLHSCKSENDLIDYKNRLKPVDRSKITNNAGLSRCKTVLDRPGMVQSLDFPQKSEQKKNWMVSNRFKATTPVKQFITNFELNSKYKKI